MNVLGVGPANPTAVASGKNESNADAAFVAFGTGKTALLVAPAKEDAAKDDSARSTHLIP